MVGARAPGEQLLFGKSAGESSTTGAATLCSCKEMGKETPEAAGASTEGTAQPGSNCHRHLPSTQQLLLQ